MSRRTFAIVVASVAVAILATSRTAMAQDGVTRVRELYVSAAYEEALAELDRLRATPDAGYDEVVAQRYRAFCLLALGRADEAQTAIEAAVSGDPMFRPADSDFSPRVRTAFVNARQRLLPTIVEAKYARAKTAFDQADYQAAKAGFAEVLTILADPVLSARAAAPPLSDLRTLASGFAELSTRIAPPPPPPAPTPTASSQPEPPRPPRIYAAADPQVVPPAIVRQVLPNFSGRVPASTGVLEVVIDERGAVETVTMHGSITPAYDRQVLTAASAWRYRPATIDGEPVKFRKIIQIAIRPTPDVIAR